MFEQDVAGLIKSLRSNKNEESKVIQTSLLEIRKEIKSKDLEIKSNAILKLVYLEMLGYSISFSSFAIIECMSSTKFNIKFIGYLAASQCFDKETEVAVLIVNLVKKDLLSPPTSIFSSSPTSLTVSHLLTTLSSVSLLLTPSLARDLAPDLLSMLTHSRPQIRKQTTLVLFRVVKACPSVKEIPTGATSREDEGGRGGGPGESVWIERLRERLGDEDVGVVSATVNLICELARKDDPREYLGLAPELFGLLTGSSNNWMLIKIIKLFAVLTPIEPRLIKKLVPPLTELIETTSAMSLLYECIQTSIVGGILQGREGEILANTCVNKLKSFLEDFDQNLRYIALVALVKILPTHPHLVSKHHTLILNCIDDPDMSIRMRALDLVEGMVDRKSLQSIVERLMSHLLPPSSAQSTSSAAAHLQAQQSTSSPTSNTPNPNPISSIGYKIHLITLILQMCTRESYSNISNFPWFFDTLISLSYLTSSLSSVPLPPVSSSAEEMKSLGQQLKEIFIDVTARVKSIRSYSVERMSELLADESFIEGSASATEGGSSTGANVGGGLEIYEVLSAAAWICGEYCRELPNPPPTIASLFSPSPLLLSHCPPSVLAQYYHNGLKLYSYWLLSLSTSESTGGSEEEGGGGWDESKGKLVRDVTEALIRKVDDVVAVGNGSNNGGRDGGVELGERCSEIKGLLKLVRDGLDGARMTRSSSSSNDEEENNGKEEGGFNTIPFLPPLSLHLLAPLFFSHELNPVHPKAQERVGVPEGLDLNSVIVPSYYHKQVEDRNTGKGEVDDYGRRIGGEEPIEARGETGDRKGKGKEGNGEGSRGGRQSGTGIRRMKKAIKEEDPVEMARLKAERLERQRDDPYYIGTSASVPLPSSSRQGQDSIQDEIDSIPIVQLSLDDFNSPSPSRNTTFSARRTRAPTPPPVFIDIDGEMPEFDDSIPSRKVEEEVVPEVETVVELDSEGGKESRATEGIAVKVVKKKKKKTTTTQGEEGGVVVVKKVKKEKKVVE